MGDFVHCLSRNIYLSRYILIRKSLPSLQLAVDKFMTECFKYHESFALRLHVGPSLEHCARVDSSEVSNKMT